jgi:hypothetical protein
MDAFESIIAGLLWEEGYWVSVGYKVALSKPAKVRLGKPSLPRTEIDILAYRAADNSALWVECKSFLDSAGVRAESILLKGAKDGALYKEFTWPAYRREVTEALRKQLVAEGRAPSEPSVSYCLAAGKITNERDRQALHEGFKRNGWILFDESWVRERLARLADKGYENDVAVQVAKLFVKG